MILSQNLTKLVQQTDLQVVVVLTMHEQENTPRLFNKAIDQWLDTISPVTWIQRHNNTVFTNIAYSGLCQTFLQ